MIGWKYTKVEDADDEVKELAQEMKAATEAKLRATFSQFEAVKFKKQYVMGTNYFIKVKVGHEQFVQFKFIKTLVLMVVVKSYLKLKEEILLLINYKII